MKIIVHGPDCKLGADGVGELHVQGGDTASLAQKIYALMDAHDISFHQVEPHDHSCPGLRFPWEDLELKLFEYSH